MTSARGIEPIAVFFFGPAPVKFKVNAKDGLNMRRDRFATAAFRVVPPAHNDRNFA